jgi:hypothetical protein
MDYTAALIATNKAERQLRFLWSYKIVCIQAGVHPTADVTPEGILGFAEVPTIKAVDSYDPKKSSIDLCGVQ